MVNTTKRSGKGKSLTHEEFDGNWTAIENRLNSYTTQQGYEIAIQDYVNQSGLNYVGAFLTIKTLIGLSHPPMLRYWVINNSKVAEVGYDYGFLKDTSLPIAMDTILPNTYLVKVYGNYDYRLWNASLYLQDNEGNFSNIINIPSLIFLQQAND